MLELDRYLQCVISLKGFGGDDGRALFLRLHQIQVKVKIY